MPVDYTYYKLRGCSRRDIRKVLQHCQIRTADCSESCMLMSAVGARPLSEGYSQGLLVLRHSKQVGNSREHFRFCLRHVEQACRAWLSIGLAIHTECDKCGHGDLCSKDADNQEPMWTSRMRLLSFFF